MTRGDATTDCAKVPVTKPAPVTNLQTTVSGTAAIATWTPSTSAGVTSQEFVWRVNGSDRDPVLIEPTAAQRSTLDDGVQLKEGDDICATVTPIK